MRVATMQPEHVDRVHGIYEQSFPLAIRAPWETIEHHRDDEELLVLLTESGEVGGFALIRHLGPTLMTFVRYLAVDQSKRSTGLGSALVSGLVVRLADRGREALLLDVEAPFGEHAHEDQRRIAFYERCGLALLDVPGYAPPAHGGTDEEVPLLLMGMPTGAGAPLVGQRLDEAVAAVLEHRYGVHRPT